MEAKSWRHGGAAPFSPWAGVWVPFPGKSDPTAALSQGTSPLLRRLSARVSGSKAPVAFPDHHPPSPGKGIYLLERQAGKQAASSSHQLPAQAQPQGQAVALDSSSSPNACVTLVCPSHLSLPICRKTAKKETFTRESPEPKLLWAAGLSMLYSQVPLPSPLWLPKARDVART